MRFVVCGEALIDLLPGEQVSSAETRWSALCGGSPMNTALGLARLGEDSHFLGRLGGDAFGRQIERYLQDNGVATDLAVRTGEPTSVAVVSLDAEGRASYTFHFQNTSNFGWRAGEFPELRENDWLHFGSIGTISGPGARAVLNFVRSTPASLSYDINVRPTVLPDRVEYFQRVEQLIAAVGAGGGIIKASDEDICWLVDDPDPLPYAEAWCIEYGLALCVVTLGPDGASPSNPTGGSSAFRGTPSRWRTRSGPGTPSCRDSWPPTPASGRCRQSPSLGCRSVRAGLHKTGGESPDPRRTGGVSGLTKEEN